MLYHGIILRPTQWPPICSVHSRRCWVVSSWSQWSLTNFVSTSVILLFPRHIYYISSIVCTGSMLCNPCSLIYPPSCTLLHTRRNISWCSPNQSTINRSFHHQSPASCHHRAPPNRIEGQCSCPYLYPYSRLRFNGVWPPSIQLPVLTRWWSWWPKECPTFLAPWQHGSASTL
jgi:hypothetical protein